VRVKAISKINLGRAARLLAERVALKLGLERVYRAEDAGNPNPSAIRLVYADRPLRDNQLSVILRGK
jgi:uncharacterized protein YdeI (YjbR/CyaY-like superfamily)